MNHSLFEEGDPSAGAGVEVLSPGALTCNFIHSITTFTEYTNRYKIVRLYL